MDKQTPRTPTSRSRLLKTSAVITTGIAVVGVAGTAAATAAIATHQQRSGDDDADSHDEPGLPSFDLPGLGSSQGQQDDGGSNGS